MELYARWCDQLSPRGFHLAARVLDFPGGKPGDVGLFLSGESSGLNPASQRRYARG